MFAILVAFATFAGSALANNVLNVNPTVANADLTVRGSDWLWAVFAVMVATALGVLVWSFMVPAGHRAFHWIGIAILFTASIAYFSMASDLGSTPVYVEFVRYGKLYNGPLNPYTRSIWYARYIDWVITTPLLLLELLLSTGMPLSGIFSCIFFDEVMIIGGLIGALVPSSYKWGYFVGATVALFYITWVLIGPARANARAISVANHKSYMKSAGLLCFLWLLYPVAWGLADGGNVISTDSEMIFYGILDLLAKPVFIVLHLFSLRKIPYESFQLQSGHFSAYASVPTAPLTSEKRPLGAHTAAVGDVSSGSTVYAAPTGPAVAHGASHVHTTHTNVGAPTHGVTDTGSYGGRPPVAHGAPNTSTYAGQMHVSGPPRTSDVTAV